MIFIATLVLDSYNQGWFTLATDTIGCVHPLALCVKNIMVWLRHIQRRNGEIFGCYYPIKASHEMRVFDLPHSLLLVSVSGDDKRQS